MAHQVKLLAAKPEDPRLIPMVHVVERESQDLQIIF